MSATGHDRVPSSLSTGRIAAIVAGALLALLGLGLAGAGATLLVAYATQRDADGWVSSDSERLVTATPALTGETLDLGDVGDGVARWAADTLGLRVRLRATAPGGAPLFAGIARERDLDRYLAGVAHDEVVAVDGGRATYVHRPGAARRVAPPGRQPFWVASSTGRGTREVTFEVRSGRWAAAVMRADGSPGVAARVSVGARAGALPLIGAAVAAAGLVCLLGAAVLLWRAPARREARS